MCQIRMYNCTFTNDCEETSVERICMTVEVFLNQKKSNIHRILSRKIDMKQGHLAGFLSGGLKNMINNQLSHPTKK